VVRTARTTKNLGKQFWGCANFNVCFLLFGFGCFFHFQSFTFIFMVFLCCRDVVKMCWDETFSSGVTKRVLMREMPLSLGKGRRLLILRMHFVSGRNRCNCH